MKGNDLLYGLNFVEEHFIEEVEKESIENKSCFFSLKKKYGVLAACFVILLILTVTTFSNILQLQSNPSFDSDIADNQNDIENIPPITSEIRIRMKDVFINEIATSLETARRWYDPELYDEIQWGKEEIISYYGRDLMPAYIPDGLFSANGNGTGRVIIEKSGKIVEDTIWLSFYHSYYEDGSPMLTEDVAATKGFTIKASKIGIINDCLYILPENEVKTSDIGGIDVTFGYRSMEYGPYDPETHVPSGYYDLYVAEFVQDGIEYYIVADQIEIEELVKVVASIIYGEKVILQ